MHSLVSLKRGQIKHYLQAMFYEHRKHEPTSGAQHLIQNLHIKGPTRFLQKPLSLLITDVLCRQGGNLWYFMHSQFRWSSPPLSLSVVLKWQHHCCFFEHSGDMAFFPLAWWNRSHNKGTAVVAVIALSLSGFRHSYLWCFPFMHTCALIWENATHRSSNFNDRKSKKKYFTTLCLIIKRRVQSLQINDMLQKMEI